MISTTHFRILALSVFAVATFFPVLSNARSTAVFDDIIVNEGAAKRGPELKMTSVVVGKVLDGVIVREPMPLMGSERAIQPNTDTLEAEKFQTALRLLRDGEKLFVNQQYEVAAQRLSARLSGCKVAIPSTKKQWSLRHVPRARVLADRFWLISSLRTRKGISSRRHSE